jgi:hypothetical protein
MKQHCIWDYGKSHLDELINTLYSKGNKMSDYSSYSGNDDFYKYLWNAMYSNTSYAFPPKAEDFVPDHVIFNDRTTVVIWKDGSKTIVRCADNEPLIEEVGFAECVVKKLYGSRANFLRIVENAYRQPPKKEKNEQ